MILYKNNHLQENHVGIAKKNDTKILIYYNDVT